MKSNPLFWIMVIKGADRWKYISAELPCNKGEIVMSFVFFHIVIAWQNGIKEEKK